MRGEIVMNMQSLMAQAQKMQREITKKQEEIYASTFEGISEWVKVVLNGKKEVLKIEILYQGSIDDDREMLSDMITIAFNDAIKKIEKEIENKLGSYSRQLGGLM